MNAALPKVRCREIRESDLGTVADLLTRGFAGRSRDYWMQGLRRQAAREVPCGYPRFGYKLDHDGTAAGVLLLLVSVRNSGGEAAIHCNLSSWCVEPAFRNYAPMLTKIAQRHHEVTYLNISPATWTRPIVEIQGFKFLLQETVLLDSRAVRREGRQARRDRFARCQADRGRDRGRGRATDPSRLLWLPQPGVPHRRRPQLTFHPAADADPARLDRPCRDAADLLPRHRRLCRLRRLHRPAPAPARQGCGEPGFEWESARPDRSSTPKRAAENISRARTGRGLPTSPITDLGIKAPASRRAQSPHMPHIRLTIVRIS